jgi:hypothetical protein
LLLLGSEESGSGCGQVVDSKSVQCQDSVFHLSSPSTLMFLMNCDVSNRTRRSNTPRLTICGNVLDHEMELTT